MKPGEIFTDSAGITVKYTPIEDVAAGSAIAEAWRPFLVVDHIEHSGTMCRMIFEGGHAGGWCPQGELVPVEIQPEES